MLSQKKKKIKEHLEVVRAWKYYRYLFWCSVVVILLLVSTGSIFAYNRIVAPKPTAETRNDSPVEEKLSIEPTVQESPTSTGVEDNSTNTNSISAPITTKSTPVASTTSQNDPIKPVACFNYSGADVFGTDIYYLGRPIVLDASCSQDAKEFLWYFNDKLLSGLGQNMTTSFKAWTSTAGKEYIEGKIKLIINGNNGLTNSIEKTIKLRPIPRVEMCYSPTYNERRSINFNEEVEFSMFPCQENAENYVTSTYWLFGDGNDDNRIRVDLTTTKHAFSKFGNSSSQYIEGLFYKGFSVEACYTFKLGSGNGCTMLSFYPRNDDPVVVNLKSYAKNNNISIEQAIKELNL